MPRPGFALQVDEKTPRLLRLSGADVDTERFALGTRVLYPAGASASANPVGLIDSALASPLEAPPLHRLAASSKLTIVVAADEVVQPRMQLDVRRTMVERVLEVAARCGVADVRILIGPGLRRGWGELEIPRVLGDRVAISFLPEGLITNHDITAANLVEVARVDGHPVRVHPRVADSDLMVVVGVHASHRRSNPVSVGIVDVDTINRLHGPDAAPGAEERVTAAITAAVPTFQLTAVLGQPLMGPGLSFLNAREWEWRLPEQLAFAGARQILGLVPRRGAQRLFGHPPADYSILDIIAGHPGRVHRDAGRVWQAAHQVEVPGSSDVLVTSVWGPEFDLGNPVGSPIAAAHHAVVERAGSHLETPLLRDSGVLLAFHPLVPNFPQRDRAAAADFFARVLSDTLSVEEIRTAHETATMQDPWYLDLYRRQLADHPLQVLHDWYRIARATARFKDVIWIGGNRRTAALLGHRAASSLADGLEIASSHVGNQPTMTYLRSPGRLVGRVT